MIKYDKVINMINGVKRQNFCGYLTFIIEEFSDELKQIIREKITKICFGEQRAMLSSQNYSLTLNKFISRYNAKNEDTKKGMIGEFILHILLEREQNFITCSPFFNMEEKSIRKGFDIIIFNKNHKSMWLVEVKSGEIGSTNNSVDKVIESRLDDALNSIEEQIRSSSSNAVWDNAINSVFCAKKEDDEKKQLLNILNKIQENYDASCLEDKLNLILTSVCFHPINSRFDNNTVRNFYCKSIDKTKFNGIICIAIQKSTYQAIYDFIKSEAENG